MPNSHTFTPTWGHTGTRGAGTGGRRENKDEWKSYERRGGTRNIPHKHTVPLISPPKPWLRGGGQLSEAAELGLAPAPRLEAAKNVCLASWINKFSFYSPSPCKTATPPPSPSQQTCWDLISPPPVTLAGPGSWIRRETKGTSGNSHGGL